MTLIKTAADIHIKKIVWFWFLLQEPPLTNHPPLSNALPWFAIITSLTTEVGRKVKCGQKQTPSSSSGTWQAFESFPSVCLTVCKIVQCLSTIGIQRFLCTVIEFHVLKEATVYRG